VRVSLESVAIIDNLPPRSGSDIDVRIAPGPAQVAHDEARVMSTQGPAWALMHARPQPRRASSPREGPVTRLLGGSRMRANAGACCAHPGPAPRPGHQPERAPLARPLAGASAAADDHPPRSAATFRRLFVAARALLPALLSHLARGSALYESMSSNQPRQPRGVPTGGRWRATRRAEGPALASAGTPEGNQSVPAQHDQPDLPQITRSLGVPAGYGSYIVGGGYRGATKELDDRVQDAATALARRFGSDVEVRFNSDRRLIPLCKSELGAEVAQGRRPCPAEAAAGGPRRPSGMPLLDPLAWGEAAG